MADPEPLHRYEEEHRLPPPPKPRRGCLLPIIGGSIVLLLGLAGLGGYAWYKYEHPTWTRFTARDGAFAIDFPGVDVKRDKHDSPGFGAKPGVTSYGLETRFGRRAYIVHFIDVDCADSDIFTRAILLRTTLEELKRGQPDMKVTERNSSNIAMLGKPACSLSADCVTKPMENGWLEARMVVYGRRLWLLMVLGEGAGPKPEDVNPFFDSFAPNETRMK